MGFLAASLFSFAYYLAPCWLVVTALAGSYSKTMGMVLGVPILISLSLPASFITFLGKKMLQTSFFLQIPKYFRFEEYHEFQDHEFGTMTHENGDKKSYIFACHPHGVFPFVATCALCSAAGADGDKGPSKYAYKDRLTDDMPTAVATVLRYVPLLKDIVGLFNIIDASGAVLANRLKRGSFALYVGGMLELFLASPQREVVFLKKRKGFIKLALKNGADVVPVYLFGNTTCLSALKAGPLAALSRKLGVSLTIFWGRWWLPVPRPTKMVYARGKPLGLPHIPNPSQDDINHWHQLYCNKLQALFENYKQFNPDYADKILVIE